MVRNKKGRVRYEIKRVAHGSRLKDGLGDRWQYAQTSKEVIICSMRLSSISFYCKRLWVVHQSLHMHISTFTNAACKNDWVLRDSPPKENHLTQVSHFERRPRYQTIYQTNDLVFRNPSSSHHSCSSCAPYHYWW